MKLRTLYIACVVLFGCFSQITAQQTKVNMDTHLGEKKELLHSVMQGRFDFFRACAVYSPLPEAAFEESRNGFTYYASGMNFAPCNGIMSKQEGIPSDKDIHRAIEFFANRGLPFIWWTSAKNLEKKGFQFGGILTGIALDISKGIPKNEPIPQVQVKIISSREDLNAFATLIVNAFGMDPSILEQFRDLSTALMNNHEQIHFLATIDGNPVGTATLSTSSLSAGIWNLGSLPEYRKNGIGTALVHAALVEAKMRHYDHVMAILMPKGMAWGLFKKMGFEEVCQFPFYVYGVTADSLEK